MVEGLPQVSSPRVDFFSAVVSDLAEAQDVSAGTSSYSAHVRSCARALEAAGAHGASALVLLDEPGAEYPRDCPVDYPR